MNELEIINDDILNCTEGLIVHGCNASGAMGSGIAKQIRAKYPDVYTKFKTIPEGLVSMGKLQIVKVSDALYIGNAITQLNYGNDGKRYASVDAIYNSLKQAFAFCLIYEYELLCPKIGCGLGGLDWTTDVKPIFKELMQEYPTVKVKIFELNK